MLINAYYANFPLLAISAIFLHICSCNICWFLPRNPRIFFFKRDRKNAEFERKKNKNFAQNVEISRNDFSVLLKKNYSGRRLYQLNEDDIILKFWFLTRFSQITSLCVLMLFKSLTTIESLFPCIDIYDDNYQVQEHRESSS